MLCYDGAMYTAAGFPIGSYTHPDWIACRNEIVENLIRHSLVEDATLTKIKVVILERLELNARLVGNVLNGDCAEIGQASFGANRCKLGIDVCDGKSTSGPGIGESFEIHAAKIRVRQVRRLPFSGQTPLCRSLIIALYVGCVVNTLRMIISP